MDIQSQPQLGVDVEVEYQDPEELKRQQDEKLQSFGAGLAAQRDAWIRARNS